MVSLYSAIRMMRGPIDISIEFVSLFFVIINCTISLGHWSTVETLNIVWYVESEFFIVISRNNFPETAFLASSSTVGIFDRLQNILVRCDSRQHRNCFCLIESLDKKQIGHSYFTVGRGKFSFSEVQVIFEVGVYWTVHHCDNWTFYFIVLLICPTCFGHYCVHHQELATMMLFTTLVVSFLVCCMLEVRCG